jgi:hypothetical protein
MTLSANLHLRDVDMNRIRVDDCSFGNEDLVVAVRIGDLSLLGTLDRAKVVIGRAHEQLLAIDAARAEAVVRPARAVLGTNESLRLETPEGHGVGLLDTGACSGFCAGQELIIRRAGDRWSFVIWADQVDTGPAGSIVVPVVELDVTTPEVE